MLFSSVHSPKEDLIKINRHNWRYGWQKSFISLAPEIGYSRFVDLLVVRLLQGQNIFFLWGLGQTFFSIFEREGRMRLHDFRWQYIWTSDVWSTYWPIDKFTTVLIEHCFIQMSGGQMSVGQMSVGQMSVGQMSAG